MALTSTYDQNTKTLTVTKGLAGDELKYNGATIGAAENEDWFGSDVTKIDASKLAAKAGISVSLYDSKAADHKIAAVTSLTLGKGADAVTVAGSTTITTGNGKDVLTITSDTTSVTITDFDQKNDALVLGAGIDISTIPSAKFNGPNVTLTFTDTSTAKATHTVTLTNGKGKLITIQNSTGDVLWEQSFQAAGSAEYDADNNNTGSSLKSDAAYIDASARSKPLIIEATGSNQQILGGKGKDTVVAGSGVSEIAGGKGDDTFIINPGVNVDLTDYTLGGKEKIQLGSGLDTFSYITNGDDVVITFKGSGDNSSNEASLTIKNGKWDQIAAEKKKYIAINKSDGTSLVTQGFRDPREVVVAKVNKASKTDPTANVFDFANSDTKVIMAGQTAAATIPNRDDVDVITFNASTPASIQAGGGFTNINAGKGKDTLVGAADASAAATKTGYTSASTVDYTFGYNNFYYVKLDSVYDQTAYVQVKIVGGKISEIREATDNSGNGFTARAESKVVTSSDPTITIGTGLLAYTYNFTRVFNNNTYTADADNPSTRAIASIFTNVPYEYTFNASDVALDGGAGNDYLFGGNVGANLYGGAGNDTLRGGTGQTTMYGGAGNDVFLLTGEGTGSTHIIDDYYSGFAATYETVKADAAKHKKTQGSDKIVISNDTYKTKAPVARATLIGGKFDDSDTLTLTVSGQEWIASVAAGQDSTTSVAAHFYGDSGITNSFSSETNTSYTANYDFKVKAGDVLNIVDQGITYKQTLEAYGVSDVKVSANYLGKVNDAILLIDGSASKKAQRLVAGNAIDNSGTGTAAANTILGGEKVDTIVGNGKTVMTGGKGNDIFVVQSGDNITDYSASGADGKDKIQVNSLAALSNKITYTVESSAGTGVTNYVYTLDNGDTITIIVDTNNKVAGITNEKGYTISLGSGDDFTENISITSTNSNQYGDSGAIQIGGITIQAGTGKAITFQQVTETPVYNAKKGVYDKTKKTTDTMIRTFSSDAKDSVISGGASTYLEAFANIDDRVVAIKGGSKAAKIVNSAKHVNSIVGGNKADTITVGHYSGDATHTDTTITVTSGKGNDVVIWDGAQEAIVTDYTTVKFDKKNKLSAGDVILSSTDAKFSIKGFKGNDVVITNGGGADLTLKNGKDKNLVFATAGFTVADTVDATGSGTYLVTVSAANPHEYLLGKKDSYDSSKVYAADASGTSETWIINAAAATRAFAIDAGGANAAKVATIYGGKGADTITASVWTSATTADAFHGNNQLLDGGAGNDVFFLNTSSDTTASVVTGAGADIIVLGSETGAVTVTDYTSGQDKLWFLNDAKITNVDTVEGSLGTNVVTKGKKTTSTEYVDLEFTLTNGNKVTFDNVATSNLKVTRLADNASVPSSKNYFSLDYYNDKIEIGAKDFAANTAVDLEGANATDITVAKAAKKVTIEGAKAGAVINVESGGKNAITYIGSSNDATYNGGGGADIYYSGTASDTVVLGSGNDSILSGGKAHVVSGVGNNVFVLGTGDNYNIDTFTTNDKVVLASTTTIEGVSYNSDTNALVITTSEEVTVDGGDKHTVKGTVTLNDYKKGDRVNIYHLGTNNKGKAAVNAELIRSYGSETLTLAKGDSTTINISSAFDNYSDGTTQITKTVNASAMTSAVVLSDSTKAVTTFIGGSGKDTIYAFDAPDAVATTLTGGKGNDYFILADSQDDGKATNAKYVISDYEAGDVIQFGTNVFSGIGDYSPLYKIDGSNIVLSDTGLEITVTGGKDKAISLGTAKITFSDPVNVKLSKTTAQTDWSGSLYDNSRVETFDASANTKDAVKFTATGTKFTTFTGNAKGSTVVINDSNTVGVTVDLGKAGGTLTLNTNTTLADTVKYTGGNIEVTNFGAKDVLSGVSGITAAAVTGAGDNYKGGIDTSSVTFNIKNATVKVTGAGVTFSQTPWAKGAAKDSTRTNDTDTFIYSYTQSVSVGGVTFAYGTATMEAAGNATPTEPTKAFEERYTYTADDLISYGDTVYSGQEGDSPFAEITTAKVAVDVNSTSSDEVDDVIKGITATFGGVGKDRQDK